MSSNFTYPPITEAEMLLGTSDKMILAVEGHTDKRYFNGIVDNSKIAIIHSNGRETVCQLVNELEPKYQGLVFGVCDNDFLKIGVGTHQGKEIYHTDYHDLEMDALFADNFSAQLNMMLSPEKLQGKNWTSDTVIEKIFAMILPIAYFRLINEKEGLNLEFKNYNLKKNKHFNSNFKLNITEFIKTIIEKTGGGELLQQIDNIKSKIENEMTANHNKFIVCNGHDFVYALREMLKEIGARSSSKIHSEEDLTDIILGTYTEQDFLASNLGSVFSSKSVFNNKIFSYEKQIIMKKFKWDAFISHASEDKEEIAIPLTQALENKGLKIWLDKQELSLGDSLRRKIDEGLSNSRFGIVILSQHFFNKEWPKKELDALISREDGREKVILPIWHKISFSEIKKHSPLLASKLAASTDKGIEFVVEELINAFNKELQQEKLSIEEWHTINEAIKYYRLRKGTLYSSGDPLAKLNLNNGRLDMLSPVESALLIEVIKENIIFFKSYDFSLPPDAEEEMRESRINPLLDLKQKIETINKAH